MKKNRGKKRSRKKSSLFSILHDDNLQNQEQFSGDDPEEKKIQQALLERPSFSVKYRLILSFLLIILVSGGAYLASLYLLSEIGDRVEYISTTDRFANEIQHARRSEKNYFIYKSNLSEVLVHVKRAGEHLEQVSKELAHVAGRDELNKLHEDLEKYRLLTVDILEREKSAGFKKTKRFQKISMDLQRFIFQALNLSRKIIVL